MTGKDNGYALSNAILITLFALHGAHDRAFSSRRAMRRATSLHGSVVVSRYTANDASQCSPS